MGVHEPTYGVLLENMQLFEGETVSVKPFIHAKIEPEIAFIFDKEVKGPSVSVTDILAATAYIAPAMEVIDSRYRISSLPLQMSLQIILPRLVTYRGEVLPGG